MPQTPVSDLLPLLKKGLFAAWEMPELLSFNKLPPRATFTSFPSRRLALKGRREDSPWHLDLNGTWDFSYHPNPESASQFLARETGIDDWKPIPVPGSWQMHGYDRHHYTNVQMPFPADPPRVPADNPTGVFRRTFEVPMAWKDRRVIVHFGGANNLLYLFLNGSFIGLSKDSHLPAEFDLTDALAGDKPNELIAVIVKWSDSTYLEDQDQWWMSGLQREVFLRATPFTYFADIFAQSTLDDAYRDGVLKVALHPGFAKQTAPVTFQAELFDATGKSVLRRPLRGTFDNRNHQLAPKVELAAAIPRPKPWSAEIPHLYTLVIGLKGAHGEEWTRLRVGFRRIEVKNRQLLVNGKPIFIKGVNHHDHDDTTGKAISRERMREDIRLIKRFNMNAIRTSHYPKDPAFLDLCDELGIYVIGEANVEGHDVWGRICGDYRYATAFLDRVMRMVVRDKNHPSILLWSLGNETGYGPNHDAAAGWIRGFDPTRLLHYEPAGWIDHRRPHFPEPYHRGALASDLVCPMYATLDAIQKHYLEDREETRPFILCEFSHAMGNSNGSLCDYWDLFEKNFHRGTQGGFIWEFLDHGIRQRTSDGREYWAYGGDFGDTPNDLNFVCDGLVSADRTPHPAVAEYRYLAQPIKAVAFNAKTGVLQIKNKQTFAGAEWVRAVWELKINGVAKAKGVFPTLRARPSETESLRLKLPKLSLDAGDEAFLHVTFTSATKTPWCDAGYLVGWEQFPLPGRKTSAPSNKSRAAAPAASRRGPGPLRVHSQAGMIVIENDALHLTVAKKPGRVHALRWHGSDLLVAGPELQIWRAPTDNDGIKGWKVDNHVLTQWRRQGLDRAGIMAVPAKVHAHRVGTVTLQLEHVAKAVVSPKAVGLAQTLRVSPDGAIEVENRFAVDPLVGDLPRLGVVFRLPAGFEKLRWFGRGPFENYSDRKKAALVDLHESTVTDHYVPYVMPQEHGHHTDVRWLSLENARGAGLTVLARGPLEFSASHFTAHDLYAAHHTYDLNPRPETILNLDFLHRGVGTHSCGPDTLPQYKIKPGCYIWKYAIRPWPYLGKIA